MNSINIMTNIFEIDENWDETAEYYDFLMKMETITKK